MVSVCRSGYERNFGNVTFNGIQNPPNYAVISVLPADLGPGGDSISIDGLLLANRLVWQV